MAVAVALVDVLYAAVGLAGAGRLLDSGELRLALGLAGAAILVGIGTHTLWRGLRARIGAEADDEVATPGRAFATAAAATALNPLTIALWTISFPRRRIGPRFLAAIDVVIGSALMLFGALLGYRALTERG